MLAFFLSGSALSRRPHRRQQALDAYWEKGSRRDAAQVVANGGVATLAALVQAWRPGAMPAAACFGALATSSADTWATEIGLHAAAPPRRITDGRPLTPGTSGGVTGLGILGSLAGALFLAAVASVVPNQRRCSTRWRQFLGIALAGVIGSFFDSVLGATVQASCSCPTCHVTTERRLHACGTPTDHIAGIAWIDNDVVNLSSTVLGATAAMIWSMASDQRV